MSENTTHSRAGSVPLDISQELAGRVALVTGAGRNIGRSIALELGARGASVGVNVRSNEEEALDVAKEIVGFGGKAVPVIGDVGSQQSVERIVRHVRDALGPVEILICNVGMRPTQSVFDSTPEEWQQLIDINLSATFYFVRAVVEGMKEAKFGRIIYISGGIAHHMAPSPHGSHAHLAATKAASEVLLRSMAPDLAQFGITCNVISPSIIETQRKTPITLPSTAAGRPGTTEEIAYLCGMLCSPRASYVTGQVILAEGGGYQ